MRLLVVILRSPQGDEESRRAACDSGNDQGEILRSAQDDNNVHRRTGP